MEYNEGAFEVVVEEDDEERMKKEFEEFHQEIY